MERYGRKMRVTVGPAGQQGRSWSELHMTASIHKTDRGRPDPAKITLTNLSPESRGYLDGDELVVLVHAGYSAAPPLIFQGTIDHVEHKREGTDWTTTIEARATGGGAYNSARLNEVWGGPLTAEGVLRRIAESMGLGLHLHEDLEEVTFEGGFQARGRAADALDRVAAELGARWSIVAEGQINVVPLEEPARRQAQVISADTGMVGSPKRIRKQDRDTGRIEARTLLDGTIEPGDQVKIESEQITGFYRVEELTHTAELGGDAFETEVKAVVSD